MFPISTMGFKGKKKLMIIMNTHLQVCHISSYGNCFDSLIEFHFVFNNNDSFTNVYNVYNGNTKSSKYSEN